MPRMRTFFAIPFFAITHLVVHADTLVLENGDRISGDLVREENGTLIFRSTLLGEIRAPAASAKIITASNPAVEAEIARAAATAPTPASLANLTYKPADDLAKKAETATEEADEVSWKRRIDLGLTAQDGKKRLSTYNVRLEALRETETGNVGLTVNHRYGKANSAVYEDATNASATLTRNVTDDLFWRGQTRYETDNILGIDHSAEQSLGLGFNLLKGSRLKLNIGGGAAVRHREAYGDEAQWDGLLDAFGKLKLVFSERLTLNQDFWMTTAPTAAGDFRLRTNTALVNKLTEMLNLSIRYEFEVNETARSQVPDSTRLVTAVGYVF